MTRFLRFLPATREMWCYNAVIADARVPSLTDLQSRCSILSPELALPSGSNATTTRSHGALHILGNARRRSVHTAHRAFRSTRGHESRVDSVAVN